MIAEPWGATLLVVVGVAAGFVNTLAGGGSLLTLPALMLLGLPADVANGTNRISVVAQSAAGALGFDAAGSLDRKRMLAIVGPTLVGSVLGAVAASVLPVPLLEPILIGALLLMATSLVYRPNFLTPAPGEGPPLKGLGTGDRLGLVAVGFYGGFIQAGVGIFLLALLGGRLRYDLVRANALKTLIVAFFTLLALTVFVVQDQVDWLTGLVLAGGTVAGARLAVRFAIGASPEALRRIVFVAAVGCAVGVALR